MANSAVRRGGGLETGEDLLEGKVRKWKQNSHVSFGSVLAAKTHTENIIDKISEVKKTKGKKTFISGLT